MKDIPQCIVLVTPVWEDSARLAVFGPVLALSLSESGLPVHWVIADDGSSALEKARLQKLVEAFRVIYSTVDLVAYPKRSRKGGAIYEIWKAFPEADWLAFVDADGAIDAESTLNLLRRAVCSKDADAVVGIRQNTQDAPARRVFLRGLSFRLFRGLVRALIGIRFKDTQCGAKVVLGTSFRSVQGKLHERGFVFDVELLLALERSGAKIEEYSIPWLEQPDGKVRPLRDAWGMVAGLLRIRRRLKTDIYQSN